MFKMIRKLIGGTWLKLKSDDNSKEYWVCPTYPNAVERLKPSQIITKECHGQCIIPMQCLDPI